ncbi:hypothetical protein CVT24_009106 [Panaeolus cyanescens]|uniref:CDP-diacylglycerol--glycerol-3-phosphate 3-phosphatidyltransferase n=1 Tax=Panaeolus cyanescens TaxID=181874 RepID=A0A409VAL3_9AGAR|nr:hypothetical protein CVT24_009106 [Panaeolus cyanescens]
MNHLSLRLAGQTRQTCWKALWHKRCIATTGYSSVVRDFTEQVVAKQPLFSVAPTSIQILFQPSEFYKSLLEMINHAEQRIFISSLYIGGEEAELISALQRRLEAKPDLKLHMLLDYNRSTRPGPKSTAKLLRPLLEKHPSQVNIHMFRSPSLRGLMAKIVPPRFNEGWGTWHPKIYGADDSVLISGANLNKSYFTNRQDRYVKFNNQRNLADYCVNFMDTVRQFSFQLKLSSPTTAPPHNPHSIHKKDFSLVWPDHQVHPHHISPIAQSALSEFQKSYRQQTQTTRQTLSSSTDHALVLPIIQAGQFKIKEEESVFNLLFSSLTGAATKFKACVDLTSGYFSLHRPYQDLILKASGVDCRIVAAAPKANGFYGSKGISGRIPEGYTLYEQRFMKAVRTAGRLWRGPSSNNGSGVLLSEWERPGWSYHAKGVWLSPDWSSPPVLTLFGSTNLNARSAHIDTELSFLMVLPSETTPTSAAQPPAPGHKGGSDALLTLRQSLQQEIDNIRSNVTDWGGGERHVRWTTKFIVWLVKGML